MNGKEISEKIKEFNNIDKIICTNNDLENYILYGILFNTDGKYTTRFGKPVVVDIITQKTHKMTLDLTNVINTCENIANQENTKRIYCMTQQTYDNYKNKNLIVTKQDTNYYKLFENELWRVVIM